MSARHLNWRDLAQHDPDLGFKQIGVFSELPVLDRLTPAPGDGGRLGRGRYHLQRHPHPTLPPFPRGKEAQDVYTANIAKTHIDLWLARTESSSRWIMSQTKGLVA